MLINHLSWFPLMMWQKYKHQYTVKSFSKQYHDSHMELCIVYVVSQIVAVFVKNCWSHFGHPILRKLSWLQQARRNILVGCVCMYGVGLMSVSFSRVHWHFMEHQQWFICYPFILSSQPCLITAFRSVLPEKRKDRSKVHQLSDSTIKNQLGLGMWIVCKLWSLISRVLFILK